MWTAAATATPATAAMIEATDMTIRTMPLLCGAALAAQPRAAKTDRGLAGGLVPQAQNFPVMTERSRSLM